MTIQENEIRNTEKDPSSPDPSPPLHSLQVYWLRLTQCANEAGAKGAKYHVEKWLHGKSRLEETPGVLRAEPHCDRLDFEANQEMPFGAEAVGSRATGVFVLAAEDTGIKGSDLLAARASVGPLRHSRPLGHDLTRCR